MRRIFKHALSRAVRDQKGFTLIEMLVVTGIIVALAAIVVPLVISFSGEGEEAAQDGERETVQTAIQSMMVKHDLTKVTPSITTNTDGEIVSSTGKQFDDAENLEKFMDQATTKYCYKWGGDGRVTFQYDVDGTDGACKTQLYPKP